MSALATAFYGTSLLIDYVLDLSKMRVVSLARAHRRGGKELTMLWICLTTVLLTSHDKISFQKASVQQALLPGRAFVGWVG